VACYTDLVGGSSDISRRRNLSSSSLPPADQGGQVVEAAGGFRMPCCTSQLLALLGRQSQQTTAAATAAAAAIAAATIRDHLSQHQARRHWCLLLRLCRQSPTPLRLGPPSPCMQLCQRPSLGCCSQPEAVLPTKLTLWLTIYLHLPLAILTCSCVRVHPGPGTCQWCVPDCGGQPGHGVSQEVRQKGKSGGADMPATMGYIGE
jgi:hypothetical protein